MTRLNLVLLLALVVSSLYLVRVSYESRRLFTELDRAQMLARGLDTEHERLQIDQRAQATPLRVEQVAREKLQMRSATPAVTEYVEMPARPASAAPAAAVPAEPPR
ncbi:MAG: cell division protein FtsL [Methylibium sp.]|uniref:cell division protein FtsL n=1 Tax=Methylibium sp. TaxID=2067992 RepID=UPI00182927C6|nr:cell division protein FtsL [Methylibium sp.]MBA3598492.1 cell division protein FtsL [Methylibium sp.]